MDPGRSAVFPAVSILDRSGNAERDCRDTAWVRWAGAALALAARCQPEGQRRRVRSVATRRPRPMICEALGCFGEALGRGRCGSGTACRVVPSRGAFVRTRSTAETDLCSAPVRWGSPLLSRVQRIPVGSGGDGVRAAGGPFAPIAAIAHSLGRFLEGLALPGRRRLLAWQVRRGAQGLFRTARDLLSVEGGSSGCPWRGIVRSRWRGTC